MRLKVEWLKPIVMTDGNDSNLIYTVDLNRIPAVGGIYIFGRRWGRQFEALYVGKASRLRGRLKSQLNNLRLINHLKNAKAGKRVVVCGRTVTRQGQKSEKSLALVERALIRYFLFKGHDLVNKQGTRLRRHEIESTGKHPKRFIPALMYLDRGSGE